MIADVHVIFLGATHDRRGNVKVIARDGGLPQGYLRPDQSPEEAAAELAMECTGIRVSVNGGPGWMKLKLAGIACCGDGPDSARVGIVYGLLVPDATLGEGCCWKDPFELDVIGYDLNKILHGV